MPIPARFKQLWMKPPVISIIHKVNFWLMLNTISAKNVKCLIQALFSWVDYDKKE